MAYYADMSPCDYFNGLKGIVTLTAVGWLERSHYSTGSVSSDFREKLAHLVAAPCEPCVFAGAQHCPFCRVHACCSNVFIPGVDTIYVAPALVYHYVQSHRYLPPKKFRDAVIKCPAMGSAAYLTSIRQIDPELSRFMSCPGQGDRQERTALIKSAQLRVW